MKSFILLLVSAVAVDVALSQTRDSNGCEILNCPEECDLTYREGCPHNCNCEPLQFGCPDIYCPFAFPTCLIRKKPLGCQECACFGGDAELFEQKLGPDGPIVYSTKPNDFSVKTSGAAPSRGGQPSDFNPRDVLASRKSSKSSSSESRSSSTSTRSETSRRPSPSPSRSAGRFSGSGLRRSNRPVIKHTPSPPRRTPRPPRPTRPTPTHRRPAPTRKPIQKSRTEESKSEEIQKPSLSADSCNDAHQAEVNLHLAASLALMDKDQSKATPAYPFFYSLSEAQAEKACDDYKEGMANLDGKSVRVCRNKFDRFDNLVSQFEVPCGHGTQAEFIKYLGCIADQRSDDKVKQCERAMGKPSCDGYNILTDCIFEPIRGECGADAWEIHYQYLNMYSRQYDPSCRVQRVFRRVAAKKTQ